jgi:rhodanese-related sulfurtransferase
MAKVESGLTAWFRHSLSIFSGACMSSASNLPLLIEPESLQACLTDPAVLIVDLCDPASYAAGHIPGAVPLDYADLVRVEPPAMGLLPTAEHLSDVLSRSGLTSERPVVAYDDEGNGRAGIADERGLQRQTAVAGRLPARRELRRFG